MSAPYLPPCTCAPGEPYHRPACPCFDPATDPADYGPPEGDPITATRERYRNRPTEDL